MFFFKYLELDKQKNVFQKIKKKIKLKIVINF